MATNENLPPNVIKQLAKELKNLDESPPEGIKVGYFLTKIFHPNIATNGEICVNTLKKDWNPSLGLRHVLIVVRCLLIEPFPESALNEQAGKMLLENYEEYARHARLYTGIHAKPKPKFKSGAISESTTALNVDQTNTSVLNADQKSTTPGTVPKLGPFGIPFPLLSTPAYSTVQISWTDFELIVPHTRLLFLTSSGVLFSHLGCGVYGFGGTETLAKAFEFANLGLNERLRRPVSSIQVRWYSPPANWFKLNSDSSSLGNSSGAGGVTVLD
ncbi:ubiquitin-conjugating enzyme e2 22 [Quercus suber]|uniref:Ubiquitin-conjugating enzyme e2 22 n=1 Tax=Quercus suber TaxID=58331 RepID=A0AAW0LRP3_QUESU